MKSKKNILKNISIKSLLLLMKENENFNPILLKSEEEKVQEYKNGYNQRPKINKRRISRFIFMKDKLENLILIIAISALAIIYWRIVISLWQ